MPNPDVDQYLDTQKFTKNMPNPDVEQSTHRKFTKNMPNPDVDQYFDIWKIYQNHAKSLSRTVKMDTESLSKPCQIPM